MADRPDKQNRKAALAAWKARQRDTARAKLPLPVEQMQALFDGLNAELPNLGCDHTLQLDSCVDSAARHASWQFTD